MDKISFFKSEGRIFKSVSTDSGLTAFVLDKETKDWRPTSVGALTEAEMYGRKIDPPTKIKMLPIYSI